ncbi:MAG: cyclic-phosphate processing receiver domain-containing protein [Nitrososphaerales archaeon]
MKIWLDDIRPAPKGWAWKKNSQEILVTVIYNSHLIEEISFDHDLGEDSLTGYDILNVIEQMVVAGTWEGKLNFHVHSANPVGRRNMQRAIDSIHRMVL